jgi:hypothetical protein
MNIFLSSLFIMVKQSELKISSLQIPSFQQISTRDCVLAILSIKSLFSMVKSRYLYSQK